MPLDCSNADVLVRQALKSLGRFLSHRDLSGVVLETAISIPEYPDQAGLAGVCYIAVETYHTSVVAPIVTAMIVELRACGTPFYSLTANVLHEADCPEHVECPLEVLSLLTPSDCKRTLEWRRNCLKGTFCETLQQFSFGPPRQPA